MFKANVLVPEIDYKTGNMIARHEILEGDYAEFYDSIRKDKIYDIIIKPHKERRSLDANAYYHVLLNKIAGVLGVSMAEVKNLTLSRYGQLDLVAGKPIELLIPEDEDVSKREDVHLQATSDVVFVRERLTMCRWYKMIRGSHTYNTEEMSKLIEGTISECREVGLSEAEIMTPNEREQLKSLYGIEV